MISISKYEFEYESQIFKNSRLKWLKYKNVDHQKD